MLFSINGAIKKEMARETIKFAQLDMALVRMLLM